MKMLISGLAVAFAATAAFAQTPPVDPMATTPPPATTMTPTDTPPAPSTEAAPKLTEKDGVWWNGDRRATTAEIAAHKAAKPL